MGKPPGTAMGSVLDVRQILAARPSQGWKGQSSRTDPLSPPCAHVSASRREFIPTHETQMDARKHPLAPHGTPNPIGLSTRPNPNIACLDVSPLSHSTNASRMGFHQAANVKCRGLTPLPFLPLAPLGTPNPIGLSTPPKPKCCMFGCVPIAPSRRPARPRTAIL